MTNFILFVLYGYATYKLGAWYTLMRIEKKLKFPLESVSEILKLYFRERRINFIQSASYMYFIEFLLRKFASNLNNDALKSYHDTLFEEWKLTERAQGVFNEKDKLIKKWKVEDDEDDDQ